MNEANIQNNLPLSMISLFCRPSTHAMTIAVDLLSAWQYDSGSRVLFWNPPIPFA